MKKPYIFLSFYLFIISFAYANLGDGIDLNGINVFLNLKAGYGNDDNVFLDPEKSEEDYFANYQTLLKLNSELNTRYKIYLNYENDIYRFADLTEENSENHTVYGGFKFQIRDFYGEIKDSYIDTDNINGILFTDRIERTTHEPAVLLGFSFNQMGIEAEYRKYVRKYPSPVYDFNDHEKDSIIGSLIYNLFPKTDLFLQYDDTDIEYDIFGRDGEYNQYGGGIRGEITSKIKGMIFGGYQDRSYPDRDESFENPVYEINIDFIFSKAVQLDLNYLLTANESIIAGDSYYRLDRFEVTCFINAKKGFYTSFGGFYEEDEFPLNLETMITREDEVYNVFFLLGYQFNDWLSLEIKYRYRERNSNVPEEEYEQNNTLAFFSFTL